jgi:hypothetical protein
MTSIIRLGTISAGAEMMMELDLAPTGVKRLAAHIAAPLAVCANCWQTLLVLLGHKSSAESVTSK